VHRDLKPENIFLASVEGTEVPKVLDFGVAKSWAAYPPAPDPGTAMGILVGTPEYMAPEQLRGEDVSPAWDVWALGLIAFEMLTGRHPFSAMALTRTGGSLPAGDHAAVAQALSGGHEHWTPLFRQALSSRPADRPAGAAAFSSELSRILLP